MNISKVLVVVLSIFWVHVYAAEKNATPRYQDLLDTLFNELTSVYDDKKPADSVTMSCSYFEYGSAPSEIVHIERMRSRFRAERAATKTFQKGTQYERQDFEVKVGESAECIFPSGSRVRVKLGKKAQDLSDRCLSQDKFMSVWVNQRKVISKALFSSQCDYDDPVIDTKIQIYGDGLDKIKQCVSERASQDGNSAKDKDSSSKGALSLCMDYPDASHYTVDRVEYPPSGTPPRPVGKLQLLANQHEVCPFVYQALQSVADTSTVQMPASFSRGSPLARYHEKSEAAVLPEELVKRIGQGFKTYLFDFNNDGKLDQVLEQRFARKAMTGNLWFVSQGKLAHQLSLSGSVMDAKTSRLFPCQIDTAQRSFNDCGPVFPKAEDASISIPWKVEGERPVFQSRYSELTPFAFKKTNFVALTGTSGENKNLLAVFRPMPNWKFKPVCLIYRVPGNF